VHVRGVDPYWGQTEALGAVDVDYCLAFFKEYGPKEKPTAQGKHTKGKPIEKDGLIGFVNTHIDPREILALQGPESVNSMSALITSGGMKAKCVASRVQRIASCARAGGTSIVAGVR
jgi:hypothetical protein